MSLVLTPYNFIWSLFECLIHLQSEDYFLVEGSDMFYPNMLTIEPRTIDK